MTINTTAEQATKLRGRLKVRHVSPPTTHDPELAARLLKFYDSIVAATPPTMEEMIAEAAPDNIVPHPTERDALIERVCDRAKAPGARDWLTEHVLCGDRFPNISSVPDAVLAAALARGVATD